MKIVAATSQAGWSWVWDLVRAPAYFKLMGLDAVEVAERRQRIAARVAERLASAPGARPAAARESKP